MRRIVQKHRDGRALPPATAQRRVEHKRNQRAPSGGDDASTTHSWPGSRDKSAGTKKSMSGRAGCKIRSGKRGVKWKNGWRTGKSGPAGPCVSTDYVDGRSV